LVHDRRSKIRSENKIAMESVIDNWGVRTTKVNRYEMASSPGRLTSITNEKEKNLMLFKKAHYSKINKTPHSRIPNNRPKDEATFGKQNNKAWKAMVQEKPGLRVMGTARWELSEDRE
jgi:hypothetical protein